MRTTSQISVTHSIASDPHHTGKANTFASSGYYGSYAFAIHETVIGVLSLGTLTLLAGAIAGANSNMQAVLGTFSSIAGQALFLTDLMEFFSVKPKVFSKPDAM